MEKEKFNKLASHPLQSWEWGEFREKTGIQVSRFEEEDEVFQITWHKIPVVKWCIGYCPKSALPDEKILEKIRTEAEKRSAVMVKWEPNVRKNAESERAIDSIQKKFDLVSGKPLFTKYSFVLDISGTEEEILAGMNQKTRYNVRLAEKRGVKIVEDNSEAGFEEYWKLTEETTKRQGFYSHTKKYHRLMWENLIRDGSGHLMKAVYEGETLACWVLFSLNGVLYYPYGASSDKHREVMASNLMMWEAIRLGKKMGCKGFDMWGSLGPEPDESDPWYGFHRFKQGYGGELVEFVGTYDLVISRWKYMIYGMMDQVRWMVLKLKARFR